MSVFNKICVVLILLVFTMGFVTATDVHDFKYPNTFEKVEDGDGYVNDMAQGLIVFEYDDASKELFLTNHDQYAFDYFEDNYYSFADSKMDIGGLFEVIDYKGDKYLVVSMILLDNLDTQSGYIQDNLEEFNELNNVEPLTI